ncbi:hypothetical protein AQF52_0835 [Streptomyces venezuelae]|uniref:hypothetical protein n=1 Tax=Streptomyces gardneri TaxID=66892 RepID=UPI0006BD55D3|nr:hypothetical protein [Streptomyces gardneri]ALO06432.1 hypothetical protein AQF52_0835 [Streptomyces venezuelae]QPK43873.1 hypothetical protein H4W23_04080 [Streptomyces gardneri]WRK35134.1 hypothetical protein U0M97_04100 [Streptomyces venezuelae]CUM43306.1 hypothetical protein BN2537_15577 [Streptomyces venezuelae]
MSDSAWARFRRHRWLSQATLTLLLVALTAGFVLVRAEQRDRHNEDALTRACGGVLPRKDAAKLLADDAWWTLRTGPGPRGLVSCTLGGDGQGDPWFTVTAEPVLAAPLKGVRVEHIVGRTAYEDEPDWAREHERADQLVTVPCPNGLPGYARPVTSFRVHAATDSPASEWLGTLVAAVAEGLRADGRCGGDPVRDTDVRPVTPAPQDDAPDSPPAECAWFRPALLGSALKGAELSAEGATHAWARACSTTVTKPGPAGGAVVSSASWWGEALPEVRTEYGRELALAGRGGQPAAGTTKKAYELAVWAEGRCAGGRTLHRLGLEGTDRELLAARADALLARYLDASGDCGDTKVLGKVWG